MPLIDISLSRDGGALLLWRITESEAELEALVTDDDRVSALRFGAASRRREHLAWRATLRTVLPEGDVGYDDRGAPFVCGRPDLYLSVSHTHGLAAVVVSCELCGVDVELAARDLSAIRGRFVSASEELLPDAARDDFAVAVWCAKEVMYKMSGRRELDFLHDLRVAASDLACDTIAGMRLLRVEEWVVVYYI